MKKIIKAIFIYALWLVAILVTSTFLASQLHDFGQRVEDKKQCQTRQMSDSERTRILATIGSSFAKKGKEKIEEKERKESKKRRL